MSSFTEPLDVRQLASGDWMTLRDISYYGDCRNSDEALQIRCDLCVTVPAGFETDFASIPRIMWPVIGHPAGRYAQAAVLHDFLYRAHIFARKRADDLFLEAMEVLGVPFWQRWAMWVAVRVGGSFAFNRQPAT